MVTYVNDVNSMRSVERNNNNNNNRRRWKYGKWKLYFRSFDVWFCVLYKDEWLNREEFEAAEGLTLKARALSESFLSRGCLVFMQTISHLDTVYIRLLIQGVHFFL